MPALALTMESTRTGLTLECQDTALALRFVADVRVLLTHADHDALVTGSADNRWEHCAGRIVAREAGLAHAGAIL